MTHPIAGRAARSYGPTSLTGMRHAELRHLVSRHFPAQRLAGPLKILDVGCGDGRLLQSLAAPGRELHGCDWLPQAPAGVPMHYTQVDLNRHGLAHCADASFDLVTSSDVIEHMESPAQMLREIARVLRPDGLAVVSFPNSWNILERLRYLFRAGFRRFRSERVSGAWGHISFFTPEVLESLCDRCKLTQVALCGGSPHGHLAVGGYFLRVPASLLLSYNAYVVLRHSTR